MNRLSWQWLFVSLALFCASAPSSVAKTAAASDAAFVAGSAELGQSRVMLYGFFPQSYRAYLNCDGTLIPASIPSGVRNNYQLELDLTAAGKGCCEVVMTSTGGQPVLTSHAQIPAVALGAEASCS